MRRIHLFSFCLFIMTFLQFLVNDTHVLHYFILFRNDPDDIL